MIFNFEITHQPGHYRHHHHHDEHADRDRKNRQIADSLLEQITQWQTNFIHQIFTRI